MGLVASSQAEGPTRRPASKKPDRAHDLRPIDAVNVTFMHSPAKGRGALRAQAQSRTRVSIDFIAVRRTEAGVPQTECHSAGSGEQFDISHLPSVIVQICKEA